jgi:hypothetical protein
MMHHTQHRKALLTAAAIVLFVWFPTKASAAPITFTFDGTATVVNPVLASRFSTGDSITGSLTYDSELVDSDADPNVGQYAPLSSLSFNLDGYTPTFLSGSGSVAVRNGTPAPDTITLIGDVTGPPAVNSFRPFRLTLVLRDATGLVLSSDGLPVAFSTSQFTTSEFVVTFTNRANPYDLTSGGTNFTGVQGTFSGSASAAATPVPEPATLTLFGSGLVGLALRLRRKQKSV